MSIKRVTAKKDNTISTAFKANLNDRAASSNMGASDILEMFSIFGHASSGSLERSRVLADFPVDEIASMRTSGEIPESGSATFVVKLFNAEHGQTTPSNYTVSAHPLVRTWNEGEGLDMESYLDKGTSNWYSASAGRPWYTYGGDFATSSYISTSPVPLNYDMYFDTGFENYEVDITSLVEEWLKTENGNGQNATGSITLTQNLADADQIKLYTFDGQSQNIVITTASVTVANTYYVELGATAEDTLTNIKDRLDLGLSVRLQTEVSGATINFTQNGGGFYGNTIISSSFDSTTGSLVDFNGGQGAPNYGLLFKLSGSYETGDQQASYYTKKYFARSSHHQLERPIIEIQWDPSVQDDRANFMRSSSLATAAENLNSIYLYNRRRTGYMDIPNTGSALLVKLVDQLGGTQVDISGADTSENYVTASRVSNGIYKADFAYAGTENTLRDVWIKFTEDPISGSHTYEEIYTGSYITIREESPVSFYETPQYITNITNLKPSYAKDEQATFRLYTRNKNWKPNLYTVARNAAPVDILTDAYYKIVRASDNFVVIDYSTGSVPSYSSLSYDASGSYFDLDMSILEPNYLYEISILRKYENDYIEQKEKFKFRVEP